MQTLKVVKIKVMALRMHRLCGPKLYSLSNFIVRTVKADGFLPSAFSLQKNGGFYPPFFIIT